MLFSTVYGSLVDIQLWPTPHCYPRLLQPQKPRQYPPAIDDSHYVYQSSATIWISKRVGIKLTSGGNSFRWIGCLVYIPATCDPRTASTTQEAQATATQQCFVKTETHAK